MEILEIKECQGETEGLLATPSAPQSGWGSAPHCRHHLESGEPRASCSLKYAELCCLPLEGVGSSAPASSSWLQISSPAVSQSRPAKQISVPAWAKPEARASVQTAQTGPCSWQELLEHGWTQLSPSPEPHRPLQTPLIGPHLVIIEHLPSHPHRLPPSASGESQGS